MANATTIIPLSGSTQGMPVLVAATSSPGTTIHATTTSATAVDRLYLWANNIQAPATASAVLLTLEWGDTSAPAHSKITPIPAQAGDVQLADGLPLLGNGSAALTVRAFAATTNVINISGYILRVQP